jgi:hypothetical protein
LGWLRDKNGGVKGKGNMMQGLIVALALGAGTVSGLATTTNLLLNPGAEAGTTTNWVVGGVSNPGVDDGSFDGGIDPHSGSYDFYGHTGLYGTLSQTVYLPGNQGITTTEIDTGLLVATVSFWEQGLDQGTPSDDACIILSFLDGSTNLISTNATPFIDSHDSTWENYSNQYVIPVDTRLITYEMYFQRHDGSDNDSFVDDNLLTVGSTEGPMLYISYVGGQVVVWWPPLVTGWTLQTNTDLTTGTWGDYTGPIVDNSVTNAPPTGGEAFGDVFFRLTQP